MTVDVSRARIDAADRMPLYLQLTQAVAHVPGVAQAGASLLTPVSGFESNRFVDVAGAPALPDKERIVPVNFVTPGWFAVYGTPLRSGRDIDIHDGPNTPPVAVVNEAFVRRFFPGRDPLGATVVSPAAMDGTIRLSAKKARTANHRRVGGLPRRPVRRSNSLARSSPKTLPSPLPASTLLPRCEGVKHCSNWPPAGTYTPWSRGRDEPRPSRLGWEPQPDPVPRLIQQHGRAD